MQIFYLKAEEKVELENACVTLGDVASILCEDDDMQREARGLLIYCFSEENRAVIDVLKLIGLLQEKYPDCAVVSLGAGDVLVERRTGKPHPVWEKIKIALIALLSFFGAAFTIMAFHNDISIEDIFSKVYQLVTGMESDGLTVLEVSYSIGLSVGIILFFNHIGTRRITKDPTPIEVQMRQYEGDVVTALVENANREQSHAGKGNTEMGLDKTQAGKGDAEAGREKSQAGKGDAEAGREKSHAGKGDAEAGREKWHAGKGNAETGRNSRTGEGTYTGSGEER